MVKYEFESFVRGINDLFIDSTLEQKQKSLEQMQYLELLDLYPKLRQEFYNELKMKEENEFARSSTDRVAQILDSVVK